MKSIIEGQKSFARLLSYTTRALLQRVFALPSADFDDRNAIFVFAATRL